MSVQIKSVKDNVVKVYHHGLTGEPSTYLASDAAASATTLTVRDNSGFSQNNYAVIGHLGTEQCEIKLISGAVTAGTSLSVSALTFAHSKGTPVTLIRGNQIRIKSASSKTGSYSTLATKNIEADSLWTRYDDTAGTSTTWYTATLYDSNGSSEIITSDPVQNGGYTTTSLGYMIDQCIGQSGDEQTWDYWLNKVRLAQQQIDEMRDKWFFSRAKDTSNTSTRGIDLYTLPTDIKGYSKAFIINIQYNRETELDYVTLDEMERLQNDVARTTLSSAISSTSDTTIDLVDADKFADSGSIVIDGDEIDYTGISGNTLTGVTNITATHAAGDVVFQDTELEDPMYFTIYGTSLWVYPAPNTGGEYFYIQYYKRFADLSDEDDETVYPYVTHIINRALALHYEFKQKLDLMRLYRSKVNQDERSTKRHWDGEKIYPKTRRSRYGY